MESVAELKAQIKDLEIQVERLTDEVDNTDWDCTGCESEVDELVTKYLREIRGHLERMKKAKRPFESDVRYSILVYQDELEDMKTLFEKLVRAV